MIEIIYIEFTIESTIEFSTIKFTIEFIYNRIY